MARHKWATFYNDLVEHDYQCSLPFILLALPMSDAERRGLCPEYVCAYIHLSSFCLQAVRAMPTSIVC